MGKLKVGVMIESFRLGVRPGIEKARELGLDGFQVYCTQGEMHPDNISQSGRRDFKSFIASKGLALSALCADFGGGFVDANKVEQLVEQTKKCIDLARDLGTGVITTHIGVIPQDENDPARKVMFDSLSEIGSYAETRDVVFGSETGPESPEVMSGFLSSLPTEAVKVNYDPANLAMKGFDPVKGVETLASLIVHTHAKDGKRGAGEVALGEGDVDWPAYIAALEAISFRGFFAIEREVGADPIADITKAAEFLRSF